MKNLKLISTILLSLMLVFTISTAVFADNELENEDIWSDDDSWGTIEDNTTENNVTNELENESLFENIELENETENQVENVVEEEEEEEYNNLYTTTNSTTSNSENLADTGIGDSSAMAVILIVSAVVAIYSARKANEYKNV